jgi:hypothetical protein
MSLPKQIILCRHVEKPSDSSDPNCSRKGEARAEYLAQFFLTPNGTFNRPDFIYAFHKKSSGLDNRSFEGVEPLIQIGDFTPSQINTSFDDGLTQSLAMIADLLQNRKGQTVLVCWEHKILPQLIQAIGKSIAGGESIFQNFRSWNANPRDAKNDDQLYSLTIVIDVAQKQLAAISQSNDFDKKTDKFIPDPKAFSKILFTMPSTAP